MNATNTHTPGPWRVAYDGNAGKAPAVVRAPGSSLYVRVDCSEDFRDALPDARLIAAAPALLAALEAYMAHVDAYGPTFDQHIRGGERPVIEAALAALRLARGA